MAVIATGRTSFPDAESDVKILFSRWPILEAVNYSDLSPEEVSCWLRLLAKTNVSVSQRSVSDMQGSAVMEDQYGESIL